MRSRVFVTAIASAVSLVCASTAYASTIAVVNSSFEDLTGNVQLSCGVGCTFNQGNVTGWTLSDPPNEGEFQPGPPGNTTYYNSVPNGISVAYANDGTISQTVTSTAVSGVTYTLVVSVGARKGAVSIGNVTLSVNGNLMVAGPVAPADGDWADKTVSYTAVAADQGKAISIILTSTGYQSSFDDVRLSDDTSIGTVGATAVPEPATLALLGTGLLGLAAKARRKLRR